MASLVGRSVFGGSWLPWKNETQGMLAVSEASVQLLGRLHHFAANRSRASSKPVFVYAHLMLPHYPYLLDQDGNRQAQTPRIEDKAAYLAQVRYVDQQMIGLVDALRSGSATPPIIIIQGDHGFRYLPGAEGTEEATSILNACFLPAGGAQALYPGITPVNVFRVILNHYFGATLPLVEDKRHACIHR
jgi:hypothetical protein